MNSNEAKINWGTLYDIPEISVNRFGTILDTSHDLNTEISRAYFLTHYDFEMLQDVLNKEFLERISDPESTDRLYLHELAFEFLKYFTTTVYIEQGAEKLASLVELKSNGKIVFLRTNRRIRLTFQTAGKVKRSVFVTPISSGSNVGCIMLLFEPIEQDDERILYTGDCRLTLKDLRDNPCLHNPDGSVKKLKRLYLDTTYCLEDAKEFPSRLEVTEELLQEIEIRSEDDTERHFDICTGVKVWHLTFLQKLAEKFSQQIHVPPNMKDFLEKIPVFNERVQSDEDRTNNRFHFDCGDSCDNEFCGGRIAEWALDFDVLQITLDCFFSYHYEVPKLPASFDMDNRPWRVFERKTYGIHPTNYHGIYSCHLSRFEMGRFANYFGIIPEDIIPIHKSPRMGDDEFLILMEIACYDSGPEPSYLLSELPSQCYDYTNLPEVSEDPAVADQEPEYVHEIKSYDKRTEKITKAAFMYYQR